MAACLLGCGLPNKKCDEAATNYLQALQPEYDIYCKLDCGNQIEPEFGPRPISTQNPAEVETWDLELSEAIQYALENSQVIRDLGGRALRSPGTVKTQHSPAIQETDPRFGTEAALSAFDAAYYSRLIVEKNDRRFNSILASGLEANRLFDQDLATYTSELSKLSAVGTRMSARHNIDYDYNNSPANDRPNRPWATNIELEVRHPLMLGGGSDFNRIAGPGATPGVYNGVLIAQVNSDISVIEFEQGIQDLVSDVETAYWELQFAYRAHDAIVEARDQALETWRQIETWRKSGLRGGTPQREARAREQYYRFEAELKNLLAGQVQERTRATTFRGLGGIYAQERNLRSLMGVPINDGRLIRPVTDPAPIKVVFDWDEVQSEATTSRIEIQRQQMQIKRRELEVVAAKSFLRPQLDAIARYRWRGLGHDLLDPSGNNPPFNDAVQNLVDGNFQEWQLGLEFTAPIGFRQAHAGVRNARLNLARDIAILDEQQRQATLEASQAVAELDRAYDVARIQLNRRIAASENLHATEILYSQAEENQKGLLLDQLLDAQTRLADSETQYVRSVIEYMMAIKQIHYAKGSLLNYNQVYVAEGAWPLKAQQEAAERASRRI